MSLLNDFIFNFQAPPTVEKTDFAKSTHKESLAVNPLTLAYQRMSLEAGLRRPTGLTFATLRRMSRVNWVDRTCIKTLTDELTAIPWDIVPIDTHKPYNENLQKFLVLLLSRPNRNKENWRLLMDSVLEDILVVDAGTIEKVRDQKGRIAELYYVDGATIKPIYDQQGNLGDPIAYQQYLPGPKSDIPVADFGKYDLIRIQWNPMKTVDNYGWGLSPVEAGLAVATSFLSAEAYNMSFFQRNTMPPMVINMGEDVPDDAVNAFRAYLAAEMQGLQGFWQPLVTAGGKGFDIKNLLANPKDMAWKDYVEWQMKWKVALYRMSPQDIGFSLDQYKVEGEVQQEISYNKAISSLKDLLEIYINDEIVNDPGWGINPFDINLKFQWIDADTVDPLDQAKIDHTYLTDGVYDRNYIRKERFGLDPIKGGSVPIILNGPSSYALNPEVLDEAEGETVDDDTEANEEMDDEEKEDVKDKVKEKLKEVVKKNTVQKKFSPSEGEIIDMSGNSTAVAWMDDRGVTQPLFVTDFGKTKGFTVKPLVLDDKREQEPPEEKVALLLRALHANTPEVKIMSFDDVLKLLPVNLYSDFTKWINLEAPYDSQQWRQRWGSTRMSTGFIVTGFITGKDLGNEELRNDISLNPDHYKNAVADLARIWVLERKFYLGDRKPGHYIITRDGNGFGVDYQFYQTKNSWEKTNKWLPLSLKECNDDLFNFFIQCVVQEFRQLAKVEKAFKTQHANWEKMPHIAELEKKISQTAQKKILNWYAKAVHVGKPTHKQKVAKATVQKYTPTDYSHLDAAYTSGLYDQYLSPSTYSDFDPSGDYITDGEYIWQDGSLYPASLLIDDTVKQQALSLGGYGRSLEQAGQGIFMLSMAAAIMMGVPAYSSLINFGKNEAKDTMSSMYPDEKFSFPNVDESIFQNRTDFLSNQLNQSMRSAVNRIIIDGLNNNSTFGDMAAQIQETLGIDPTDPAFPGYRAERIARTESMWAINETLAQMYEANNIMYVDIVTRPDACDECIGEAENNPYLLSDIRGGIPIHPNCYCKLEPSQSTFTKKVLEETLKIMGLQKAHDNGWITVGGRHIYVGDEKKGKGGKGGKVEDVNVRGKSYKRAEDLVSHEGAPDKLRVAQYKRLINAGHETAPLLLTKEPSGKMGVEDGKHRLEAYRQLGHTFVPTIVREQMSVDQHDQYNRAMAADQKRMENY